MERPLGSRYRLGELLGRGAMGQVFAGVDADGQEFAFKILRSDLTGNPDIVARFLQERSILVGLRHPNLVTVHDLVAEGETVAIVMDLVPGGDLRQWLTSAGTLLPSEIARIGAGVGSALAHVHSADVVHRDVKPENILMDSSAAERIPRLTDFGISRLHSTDIGRSSLLAGTPQYVAPELAAGEDPTPAADLYSLGIVLYELCCGVTPFAGNSMLAVIKQHAEAAPGRPDGIPDPLWDLISWMLHKSPRARPQSAQQVATLLGALAQQLIGVPVALRLDAPPPSIPVMTGMPTQTAIPIGGPVQFAVPPPPPARRRKRKLVVVATVAVLLLGGGGLAWATFGSSTQDSSRQASTPGTGQLDPPGTVAPQTTTTTTTTKAQLTNAPNLVGKKLSEAQDMLPSSLDVEVVDSIQQGATPGTVVAQDPEPSAPLNGKMKLTVAREAVEVYLEEVRPVSGEWSQTSGARSIAGKTFAHTVANSVDCYRDGSAVEFNIAKGFRRLVATGGMDDNSSDAELTVQLEIFGDGRRLASTTLAYGKPTPIDVDLSGVLRLKIQWQVLQKNLCGDNFLVLGNATLLGLPGEVPTASSVPTS